MLQYVAVFRDEAAKVMISSSSIYVAVFCSVLQCAAVCYIVLVFAGIMPLKQPFHLAQSVVRCSVLQCVAVCCSALQCVAVCCSVLQCVAVCCSVLHCSEVFRPLKESLQLAQSFANVSTMCVSVSNMCVSVGVSTMCVSVSAMCVSVHR